jgi:hypothetical protein
MHVVQLEVRRSLNVVLNPMALEPIMVCAWPLGLPGATIGSTRELRTGWAHGIRQKALEDGISTSPRVKRETIILQKKVKKKE